eukprot:2230606-Alexandrium_andersonii.AAC.1
MWEELFVPLAIDMLPDGYDLPPFSIEPYRERAARAWNCPSEEVAARVAVHLPDRGLCREYE